MPLIFGSCFQHRACIAPIILDAGSRPGFVALVACCRFVWPQGSARLQNCAWNVHNLPRKELDVHDFHSASTQMWAAPAEKSLQERDRQELEGKRRSSKLFYENLRLFDSLRCLFNSEGRGQGLAKMFDLQIARSRHFAAESVEIRWDLRRSTKSFRQLRMFALWAQS